MKKLFTLSLLSTIMFAASAQATYPTDGYYRVSNKGTHRYVYVSDNVGSMNIAAGSAEMGALCLYMSPERRLSDPASVIYFDCVDNGSHKYDLRAQGTGVYQIIQHYVQVAVKGDGIQLYASSNGLTKYLADGRKNTNREDGKMDTEATGDYRIWYATPVDASTDEYFGIKPIVQSAGKYYYPFYASFPFSFYSSGMKAYYISKVDAALGMAVIKEYTGDVKAGATPFIIECSSDAATNNRLNILANGGTKPSDNQLQGNYFFNPQHAAAGTNAYKVFDAATMRLLEVDHSGKLVFTNQTSRYETYESNTSFKGVKFLPANQSYITVPTGTVDEIKVVTQEEYDEETSGISSVCNDQEITPAVYDLSGKMIRRAGESTDNLPAGTYIMGGRKIQVR